MYATNYARLNGFGYAFGGPEDCQGSDHYDPTTDSCFTCEPGWVYQAAGNTCRPESGGSGGGGGGTVYHPSTPSGAPSASKASILGGGAMPWILGGVAVIALIAVAKHHKSSKH